MAENTSVNILKCLMKKFEKGIDIYVGESIKFEWEKSLKNMPLFTIKDIELHRKSSGKIPSLAIVKTSDRAKKFKEERYISADSITTSTKGEKFYIKRKCKASMKKEFRNIEVSLDQNTGFVTVAKCSCPAGNSGYCNPIMALLFELADYSLNQLDCLPEEISCTSKNRQLGIPSEAKTFKHPIIKTPIRSDSDKKGVSSTLYDRRRSETNILKISDFQTKLKQKDKRIGFAHAIDLNLVVTSKTQYGDFVIGSTLSHQLLSLESHITVITNFEHDQQNSYSQHDYIKSY